jgi:tetratricopeptide (TPR) repeat protein
MHFYWAKTKLGMTPDEAFLALEELRGLSPDSRKSALYSFVTGLIRKKMGDKEEAIRDIERSLQIEPSFMDARRELGALKSESAKLTLNDVLAGDITQVITKVFKKKTGS